MVRVKKMKIYIASSWKNECQCLALAKTLRDEGYEVDCFCDSSTRYVFNYTEWNTPEQEAKELTAIDVLKKPQSQKAYNEDFKWLNWADTVILVLPAGRSAHLEAGYKKGQGGRLIIFSDGGFPKGEWDIMYGMANILIDDIIKLLKYLRELSQQFIESLIE